MRPNHRVSRAAGAASLALFVACSESPSEPRIPVEQMAPVAEVTAYLPTIADATHRVLPALRDRAVAATLRDRFSTLERLLRDRRPTEAAAEIRRSRETIAGYRSQGEFAADLPDLAALLLALDRATLLLGQPLP